MNFNSKIFAIVLASAISILTTSFLYITDGSTLTARIVTFGISFGASFIFIYLTFEFLIFKEINDLYSALDKMRKNEKVHVRKPLGSQTNPIKKLNREIFDLAFTKQKEIDDLKKMEEYRREFLANVSHELKTPIFSAQGFIHTLIDGALKDKDVRKKFLKKASKSLDALSVLVQDLITISQLEAGQITMQQEYFDLQRMTVDIFEQLEAKAHKKEMKLVLSETKENPVETYGDPERIRQVLTNLIDNAIKYGNEQGQITVDIEEHEEHVKVSIADDGPGISEDKLPRIFERFYRVDKHRSRESGGTGLGLSIVKHIIESHDTSISVESSLDNGTKFTFNLPHLS